MFGTAARPMPWMSAARYTFCWLGAPRPSSAAALLTAEAAAGRYDADVVRVLLNKPQRIAAKPPSSGWGGLLTEREKDVLRWISLGASNKVVAQKLSISPSTVRTHVESVFRKLECSTRAAATLKATQLGLL